ATRHITLVPPEERATILVLRDISGPCWVLIKRGKYKGDIGYIDHGGQKPCLYTDVYVVPHERPYDTADQKGSQMPFSAELAEKAGISFAPASIPITCCGNNYFNGLLNLKCVNMSLEIVNFPHPESILDFSSSDFCSVFVQESLHKFSSRFWKEGDPIRVQSRELFDNREYEVPVSSLWRIFAAGDHVKVLLGNHREFTGYVIIVRDRELVLQDGKSDNVTLSNDVRILECSLFCILTCEIGDCPRLLRQNIQTQPYYVPRALAGRNRVSSTGNNQCHPVQRFCGGLQWPRRHGQVDQPQMHSRLDRPKLGRHAN
ncbi:hypothetical protein SCLCIDRAFT_131830, partial [Scleroderma citrinum Foug A]